MSIPTPAGRRGGFESITVRSDHLGCCAAEGEHLNTLSQVIHEHVVCDHDTHCQPGYFSERTLDTRWEGKSVTAVHSTPHLLTFAFENSQKLERKRRNVYTYKLDIIFERKTTKTSIALIKASASPQPQREEISMPRNILIVRVGISTRKVYFADT